MCCYLDIADSKLRGGGDENQQQKSEKFRKNKVRFVRRSVEQNLGSRRRREERLERAGKGSEWI